MSSIASQIELARLRIIQKHCQLKAKASRWAIQRRKMLCQQSVSFKNDIHPTDQALIQEGKEEQCLLWMNHLDDLSVPDDAFHDLSRCYDMLAEAIGLVLEYPNAVTEDHQLRKELLAILATTQAALRSVVGRLWSRIDPDQQEIHNWLREMLNHCNVYVGNVLRADKYVDPACCDQIHERIISLHSSLERERKEKNTEDTLALLQEMVNDFLHTPDSDRWNPVAGIVHLLVKEGLPPSNIELRNILLPVTTLLPKELAEAPVGFRLAVREIERFLSDRKTHPDPDSSSVENTSISKVRNLLKGKVVAIIGGEERTNSAESLKLAFQLKDVIWIEAKAGMSHKVCKPHINREEVALVLLAIRWCPHSFKKIKKYCDKGNKPLVLLPGGYNPAQVADQVLHQCSDRLQGDL